MREALKEAQKALKKEEVPVGAIIVKDGKIIARAHNTKETKKDSTCHAEIIAIKKACKKLDSWRLLGCEMYVTLEPCPMCGWAIIQSRIKNLYFGSYDANYGAFSSKIDLRSLAQGAKLNVYGGIKEQECDKFLKDFFIKIR